MLQTDDYQFEACEFVAAGVRYAIPAGVYPVAQQADGVVVLLGPGTTRVIGADEFFRLQREGRARRA